jgi:hypothetical protein
VPLAAGQFEGNLSNGGEQVVLQLPNPYDAAGLRFAYDDGWYGPLTDGDGLSLVILDATSHRRTWGERSSWRPSSAVHGSPGGADAQPSYPAGAVVVTEVLAHQDTATGDWIELYNAYDQPIDLAGWFVSDDASDLRKYEITAAGVGETVLEPGEYLVLTEADHFGGGSVDPGRHTAFALSEYGEEVWVSSGSGGVVGVYRETVVFGASANGVTMGRYTTSVGAVHFVALEGATRGYVNAPPQVGPVVMSELMYHPVDEESEFVELHNPTGEAVPLYDPSHPENTWALTEGVLFSFPQGAVLPAGGYALVTRRDPAQFRSLFGVPAGVAIYGPFEAPPEDPLNPTALSNAGETVELRMPGAPDPVTGEVPSILVDAVNYEDGAPWPVEPDGDGPSLVRVSAGAYGNDVANWAAGTVAGGTPGTGEGGGPPRVTAVALNSGPGRTPRSVGAIEPSGLGVETVEVTFDEAVTFDASAVTVERVSFDAAGVETVDHTFAPAQLAVSGSGTPVLTVEILDAWANAVDTWVKVTLASSGITDASGHALDGEPAADSSGLGYIREAALDLPSGDGAAGGDAVFYVGSLRGDLRGSGVGETAPDGQITQADIDRFTSAYQLGLPEADFRGSLAGQEWPDGQVTQADIDRFTSLYQSAQASGLHLEALPAAGGAAAGQPVPVPLVVTQPAEEPVPVAPAAAEEPAAAETPLLASAPSPVAPETSLLASDDTDSTLGVGDTTTPSSPATLVAASSLAAPPTVTPGAFAPSLTVEADGPAYDDAVWAPPADGGDTTAGAAWADAGALLDVLASPALDVVF